MNQTGKEGHQLCRPDKRRPISRGNRCALQSGRRLHTSSQVIPRWLAHSGEPPASPIQRETSLRRGYGPLVIVELNVCYTVLDCLRLFVHKTPVFTFLQIGIIIIILQKITRQWRSLHQIYTCSRRHKRLI